MAINGIKRISNRMEKEIKDIDSYRNENKLNKLTFVKITELICKHKNFTKIKEDIATIENEK